MFRIQAQGAYVIQAVQVVRKLGKERVRQKKFMMRVCKSFCF